jgi:hypothetical protein
MFSTDPRWLEHKAQRDRHYEQARDYNTRIRWKYFNGEIDCTTYRDLAAINRSIDGVAHRKLIEQLYSVCDLCGGNRCEGEHDVYIAATENEPASRECFDDHIPF